MNDLIEIMFCFDTTGSMYPCLGQVRKKVEELFAPLFKEMPNLRIGVGANGDYCDERTTYVTKFMNLTTDLYSLTNFVRTVQPTGGGDAPECYELVLHQVQKMNWTSGSKRIVVLIADDVPHGPAYYGNTLRLDWREEARRLRNDHDITVYAVQALNRPHATSFYRDLAAITDGYHLKLDQFSEILELIRAVTYRQQGVERVETWEKETTAAHKMTRSLEQVYLTLTDKGVLVSRFIPTAGSGKDPLSVPVEMGRFQVLDVDHDVVIRNFVEDNGLIFKPGRGFYEFTKREEVQEKKEIVVRDKETGDMFSGEKARYILGVAPGERANVSPTQRHKYDIFIQSTSYNRKLKSGTKFLYEVDMDR